MNTYDAAYDLAKAIKESDEMKRLTAAADKVKNQHLQELAVLVSNNSNAQEYLQAFIRWNQVAADLQKIVSDAMAQGMDVLELDKK